MLKLDISSLPVDSQQRIDRLCRNYESELGSSARCDPLEFLDKVSKQEQPVLLYELLRLHIELEPHSGVLAKVLDRRPEFDWVIKRITQAGKMEATVSTAPNPSVTVDSATGNSCLLTVCVAGAAKRFPLAVPGQYTIGTEEGLDVCLDPASGLSPRQACLLLEQDQAILVYLNPEEVIPDTKPQQRFKELGLSAKFKIAETEFQLDPVSESEAESKLSWGAHQEPGATDQPIQIDGFELQREIGRGSFGVVYDALQLGTGKRFAIKSLLPDAANAERLKTLFMREISVISQLAHPNVVAYHGFGIAGECPYLILEYVDALDLDEVIERHAEHKRLRLAVGVVTKTLLALSHAHDKGIVHRDVKLSNILAGVKDRRLFVKLADFGLAKFFETAGYSGMTATGALCGTIGYMSPEQLSDSKYAEPDCDVYAAAVCLYRLLTGNLPHHADSPAEIIRKRLHELPEPLEAQNPHVPADLAALIQRALHPDRDRRFRTAEELSHSLAPYAL